VPVLKLYLIRNLDTATFDIDLELGFGLFRTERARLKEQEIYSEPTRLDVHTLLGEFKT
jgi:hypothetical protein